MIDSIKKADYYCVSMMKCLGTKNDERIDLYNI